MSPTRRAKATVIGSRQLNAAVFQFSFVSFRISAAASCRETEPQFSPMHPGNSAPRRRHAHSVRPCLLPLILVLGQSPLIVSQIRQKSETSDAIGRDPVMVNDRGAVEQLAEIVPVEAPSVLEFLGQACRVESIPRRPEFHHYQPPDQRLV